MRLTRLPILKILTLMQSSPGSGSSSPAYTAVIRGGECAEAEFANDPPDHMISHLGELIELVGGLQAFSRT